MSNNLKKVLSLIMALAMVFAFAACGEPATTTPTPGSVVDGTPTPGAVDEPTTLAVGYDYFSQKFSPFFAKTAYDQDAYAMTQIGLIGNDRAGELVLMGIEGETMPYNGVDYFYDGIADTVITQNDDGTVDYDITIREDIVFSDGTPLTIADVIFSMYVLSDPTYDGSSTFYAVPIKGMEEYRAGMDLLSNLILAAGRENTDFTYWTEEQQTTYWAAFDVAGVNFAQDIVDYVVANYVEAYAQSQMKLTPEEITESEGLKVAFGMIMWGYAGYGEDGVFYDNAGESYDLVESFPTAEAYWAMILENCGYDVSDAGINAEVAATSISEFIDAELGDEAPTFAAGISTGESAANIEGIVKTSDNSIRVTTTEFAANAIYQMAVSVAPMHYYGDASKYDYDNNSFGFTKGDLSCVRAKTTVPMGAGPYVFDSFENGVITYHANENYFKGKPATDFVLFQETSAADKLSGVKSGQFDLSDPSFSAQTVEDITAANSNGELIGDVITTSTVDNLGYGYIGICSTTMNVDGVGDSEASKNLRKAFATMFSVHRDTVINSYYGERASVIQYPISNTSWAAPRPADEGYEIAYSKDVDGNSIYTEGMSDEDKYVAALDAAVGFLKAAGYTFDEATGTFTGAPEGAALVYEAMIPADGSGDHPAFGVLTAVKEQLATIGITLEINDLSNSNDLWTALESGNCYIWAAAWNATIDPDMYQVYHSSNIVGLKGSTESNHYGIQDADLDELIIAARQSADQSYRKTTYKQCLDIILDWGVEIPTYQRQNALIFSTERINMETMTKDITTFYGWMSEIENIKVN